MRLCQGIFKILRSDPSGYLLIPLPSFPSEMPPSPLGRLILFFLKIDFFDFCIAPKAFKGIEFANFLVKNMHDYAGIVHKYPACGSIAFYPLGRNAVLVAKGKSTSSERACTWLLLFAEQITK